VVYAIHQYEGIFLRKYKWKFFIILVLGFSSLLINYQYISYSTKDLIFDDFNKIENFKYALFLGTPKFLPNGKVNNYYKNRISRALELYKKNKIEKIIISADILNKYKENELDFIENDLIQGGVNKTNLLLDKNGHRTWNSVLGAKKISKNGKLLIISQKFHLERALYIAKRHNIKAIGFKAKGEMSNKLFIREVLARVKMQLDFLVPQPLKGEL